MELMDRLREHARVRGRWTALEWPGRCMDFRTLVEQVEAVARQLRACGIRTLAVDLEGTWITADARALAGLPADFPALPLEEWRQVL